MQTWSQSPRPRLTLLPEEQIDSLKQSIETRRRIFRHLTLVHASPVRNGCLLPSLCPGVKSPSYEGVVELHKDIEACPYEQLQVALAHPKCLVPGEKEQFLQANNDLLSQLQGSFMPLEGIAPQVFEAIYQRQQGEILWVTVLWMIAQLNEYWIGHNFPPLPSVFQINCGGLGGGALEGDVPPHFHCMCPPVGESQVYGPSLSPADVAKDQEWGVAYGWSTGVHEVATLFALTQNPCQK